MIPTQLPFIACDCVHSCIITDADFGIPYLRQVDTEAFREKEERRRTGTRRVYLAPEVRNLPFDESTPSPADVYRYIVGFVHKKQ